MPEVLLDAAGRPRSPATVPGFHTGRSPRNKGQRYPAEPPTVAEIVAVMRHAGTGPHAARLRALIVVLWRAGLRIHEAWALGEADLDQRRGSLLVRRARADAVVRSAWTTGLGSNFNYDSAPAATFPLVRCCASPPARRAIARGQRAPHVPSSATPPPGPAFAAGSYHISSPRPRRRDGPRGRPADRHPTSARAHQPRHHLDLPIEEQQSRPALSAARPSRHSEPSRGTCPRSPHGTSRSVC